tara:strand:- start:1266 stop:2429 length:1164 start_codon:yes stop_codon:yes gene_type:complete
MKKKIAILGSTGSIGKNLLNIISKENHRFDIILLTANKNYKELIKQVKNFNVRNVIINNQDSYKKFIKINKNKNLNIYQDFNSFNKIFKKKIDYTMSSIVGIEGLYPTINIIKFTKVIAIANKESIICAWNLLTKELKKNKTKFIPVDSEHFSIWYALEGNTNSNIDKIYLTASGGSLLNIPKKKFNKLNFKTILKHPNWKMGKKITIDSSTMMNKVFEIIEAKKIFNLEYKQLGIITHPKSYIHAIVKFSDGMIKIIAHDTTMKIPIFNSIYFGQSKKIKSEKVNFIKLNNLNLKSLDKRKFSSVKILNTLPKNNSLFETVLVAANDELVNLYLNKKINYSDITNKIIKILSINEFKKLKKILPTKVSDVINTSEIVRKKIELLNN